MDDDGWRMEDDERRMPDGFFGVGLLIWGVGVFAVRDGTAVFG